MKKFLGSLFILLVAGGAAAPYVSGYFAKKHFYQAVEALSKIQNHKIDVVSYEMGWLTSHAVVKVTLPQSAHAHFCPDSKEPLALNFEETIQHGPILLGKEASKMEFGYASIHEAFAGIDESSVKSCASLVEFKWPIPPADIYSADTVVAFNGNLSTKIKGKAFEHKGNTYNVKWQGLNGEMNLNNHMTVLNYKMTFPSLEVSEQTSNFKTNDISIVGDHQKMANRDMWLGEFKLNIGTLDVKEGQMVVALKGMTFGHVLRLVNNLLSASANYVVDSATFDDINLGPINMMFSFHHLEPSFVEMMKQITNTAKETPDGFMAALKAYQSKDKEDALTLINKQLKLTPEAKIDQIIVQGPKGQVLVNALASLGGPDAKLDKLENYFMLVTMSKASGEFNLDEAVFDYMLEKQSQETANSLPKEFWAQQQTTQEKWVADNVAKLKNEAIETGVFVKEGNKLISRFKYENNRFTINGKSIDEIMAKHAELNKPKVEPAPAPVAPAPVAPVAPTTPVAPDAATQAPQAQPTLNNPNDPAKPSEPMPVSEVKEMPKMPTTPVEGAPASTAPAAPADMPKPADMPAAPAANPVEAAPAEAPAQH